MASKTQKAAVGQFKVFHLGKMLYSVEDGATVFATFPNLSQAFAYACRLNDMGVVSQ